MDDDIYKQYCKYLTAHYEHLRMLELGFESIPPKLSDYSINGYKFDSRLSAEGLDLLHNLSDKLKNWKISEEEANKIYAEARFVI